MSGKDEKPIGDFPSCPKCFDTKGITFWKGFGGANIVFFDCTGLWGIVEPRVIVGTGTDVVEATLEQINQVDYIRCGNCGMIVGRSFNEIIELGRNLVVGKR